MSFSIFIAMLLFYVEFCVVLMVTLVSDCMEWDCVCVDRKVREMSATLTISLPVKLFGLLQLTSCS